MTHTKSFLGVGWKFPPTFNRRTGTIMLVSEEEDIRESLEILLSTRKAERIMLPEFGCNLQEIGFETINGNTISRLQSIISEAIRQFEARITVENITVDVVKQTEGKIDIIVDYTVNRTNQAGNLVYPYYLTL